ncbi:MAG: branched-chain amino acid ABC transporter permease [Thermoleophilaceae bacterium]
MRLRNLGMTTRYEHELRLLRSRPAQLGALALLVLYAATPMFLSDFWLSVLAYAGISAIGAIGLNLLTGYTGQVSLGHATFIGAGAYAAGYFGGDLGLPLPLWLLLAAVAGGLLGALVGPFALRLRGNYLVIITLGLVFVGEHVFSNWDGLTGGNAGRTIEAPVSLGFVDFDSLSGYTREQSWFWLIWALVAVAALLAKNIVRSRPGRAMQAVRDRDVAAEVIGVSLARYKVGAFVISSALAAVAGGLFGAYQQFVSPTDWSLFLSIQFIAIIIVGGLGTVFGAVLGALFVGSLPRLIEEYSGSIPGVSTGSGDEGFITVFALNQAIFGLLIVGFLVFEPRGLAALWLRLKAYFKGWPFSY